ncbi:50S ribosomal protein L6 [Elongatibacter sediminis]|uniref:Large ribosomal subunit protein uL6 n=1 Tax=Elongatibacter sediminis TaxID=3119006 RepID=A0AAW9RF45_9GAMM
MSRVAKAPIALPSGVEFNIQDSEIRVKGPKGALALPVHPEVELVHDNGEVRVEFDKSSNVAMAGTYRSLVNNLVVGVTEGFEKKLSLIGVGYRAQVQGNTLSLALGFSHPVEYKAPEGITIEAPSQTEVVVKGCDKQRVGQVAAEIRAFRPPEPYKGKGVRYADEYVARKEAKKA